MDNSHRQINSLIAIGNPIVDISAETDEHSIEKFELEWGRTVFANDKNIGIFEELEKKPEVSYVPGGSIQNSLRVASWCLNMNEETKNRYKLTMLGCVGNDIYKDKIQNALKEAGVNPLLQINSNMKSSRCAVGIFKKERCLVPEIKASNTLNEEFVEENKEDICGNDCLLIEGYFIVEKYNICLGLAKHFQLEKKPIIFTLSAVFLMQYHMDKVIEIANMSDLIFGNMEECEALAGEKFNNFQDTIEAANRKLSPKDRILIITCGNRGVLGSKFNYQTQQLEFILQRFPSFIKQDDIVDLNGAGDAFLGGYISQWMQGKSMDVCCKAGNDASGVILRNVGCTFPKNGKIQFDK